MRDEPKALSVHFQILIVGTILFLAALFWPILDSSNWPDARIAQCTLFSLWLLGGYMGFVVLVAGHALLENRESRQKASEQVDRPSGND